MNKIFVPFLPPWVETGLQPAFYDKESGTVLQQTARMYDKVNQLIRNFNELSEETKTTVEEYILKFNDLKDFVDDYFDNLDVQEEINTKLDAMVEDGTLQEIITTYIQSNVTWTFDSVADMKDATNLIDGSYAQTLGYYSPNDGGNGQYIVRTITADDVVDEGSIIALSDNTLVAELVASNGKINVNQFGAKGDGVTNDSTAISSALKYKGNEGTHITFTKDSTYLVDGNFYIYSNTSIDLNDAVIKVVDGTPASDAYNRVQFLNNLESMTVAGYGALENFHVKNGTFNGNIGGVAFALFHALNCSFKDIEFKDCFVSTHVFDLAGCKDIEIKNCKFVGNLLSVSANSFREVIQPDYASYTSAPYWGNDDSYEYDGIETVNLTVDGCLFKKNQNDTYYLNGVGTHATGANPHDNIVVKNCTFYDSQLSSIRLPQANNITIEGNTFYNIGRGRVTDYFAVDITNMADEESLHDVTVKNNKFISTGDTTDQIFLNVSGRASHLLKNVQVIGNEYYGTAVSNSGYTGSDFVHANHIDGFILNGNHIVSAKAILYKPSGTIENFVYNDNVCDNCLRGVRGAGSNTDDTDGSFPDFFTTANNVWKNPLGSFNTTSCRVVLGLESDFTQSSTGVVRLPLVVKKGLPLYINGDIVRIPDWFRHVRVTGYLKAQTTGDGTLQWTNLEMWDRPNIEHTQCFYDQRLQSVGTSRSVYLGEIVRMSDDFVSYFSSEDALQWKDGHLIFHVQISVTGNTTIKASDTYVIVEFF